MYINVCVYNFMYMYICMSYIYIMYASMCIHVYVHVCMYVIINVNNFLKTYQSYVQYICNVINTLNLLYTYKPNFVCVHNHLKQWRSQLTQEQVQSWSFPKSPATFPLGNKYILLDS